MESEDESPLIFGLEAPARALAASLPDDSTQESSGPVRFLVGTLGPRAASHSLHVLEFGDYSDQLDDDSVSQGTGNETLTKVAFPFTAGEIWWLAPAPLPRPHLLAIASRSARGDLDLGLWTWPGGNKLPAPLTEEAQDGTNSEPLKRLSTFRVKDHNLNLGSEEDLLPSIIWHPDRGDQVLACSRSRSQTKNQAGKIYLWDAETAKAQSSYSLAWPESSGGPSEWSLVRSIRWSPHSGGALVGWCGGRFACARDLRVSPSSSQSAWSLQVTGWGEVRDMDWNPNAAHYVATADEGGSLKFWDVRQPSKPQVTLDRIHSHWCSRVRYNPTHDELVLSSGSDSRVALLRVRSLASHPFGHLLEEEETEAKTEEIQRRDGLVALFEEHEDGVYACEWAAGDAFLFASLSLEGRLVLNRVPQQEKFAVLF